MAEEVREEMNLPSGYFIVPLGNAQVMQQTMKSLWSALVLGFIVAYMILGVQFNSFVHPFTVLMAVPFGVTGAQWPPVGTAATRSQPDEHDRPGAAGRPGEEELDRPRRLRQPGANRRRLWP